MPRSHINLKAVPGGVSGVVSPGTNTYRVPYTELEALLTLRKQTEKTLGKVVKGSYMHTTLSVKLSELDEKITALREKRRDG